MNIFVGTQNTKDVGKSDIAVSKIYNAEGAASIVVMEQEALFLGDYSRQGPDLLIEHNGATVLIVGYFDTETPANLAASNGAFLSGDVVTSLAGEVFGGQLAQSGGGSPASIGSVIKLEGTATSTNQAGIKSTLKVGDPVYQGDVVQTGADSKLGVKFIDKTVFSMSAKARMVMDELVYDPADISNSSMALNLVEGAFVFVTGEIAPTGNMKIDTPVATMGIRGTTPRVVINTELGISEFTILPDPDTGIIGKFLLINKLTGAILGTVQSTSDKWVVTTLSGDAVRIQKTGLDLLEDQQALDEIQEAFTTSKSDRAQLDGSNSYARVSLDSISDGGVTNESGDSETTSAAAEAPTSEGGPEFDDPPEASDDVFVTDDRTLITAGPNVIDDNGQGLDVDPEGYALIVTQVNEVDLIFVGGTASVLLPSGALLLVNAQGDITYSPNGAYNFLGLGDQDVDSFTYTIQDVGGNTDVGTVEITLTGRNDQPEVTDIVTTVLADAFTEANDTGNVATVRTAIGSVTFQDTDASDTHTATASTPVTVWTQDSGSQVTLAPIGSIALVLTETAPDTSPVLTFSAADGTLISRPPPVTGDVGWTYSVAENEIDFLAVGETLQLVYTITMLDDSGVGAGGNGDSSSFITRDVTITVTGTNDGPQVGALVNNTPTLSETEGALSTMGSIALSDVDTTDVVSIQSVTLVSSGNDGDVATPSNGDLLNLFVPRTGIEISGTANTSTLDWTFNAGTDAFDYLAVSESLILTYTVVVADDNGAPVAQDVVVTIDGTNDDPVIGTLVNNTPTLTETEGALSTMGSIALSDVDTTDVVSIQSVTLVSSGNDGDVATPSNGDLLNLFVPRTGIEISGTANTSTLDWTFNAGTDAFDYLAVSESLILTYTVVVADDNGASIAQDVVVTIDGTNDVPVIGTLTNNTPTLTETEGALSTMGSIVLSDVDTTDVVSIQSVTLVSSGNDGDVATPSNSDLLNLFVPRTGIEISGTANTSTLDWTFNAGTDAFDYLAVSESLILTYTVVVADDNGASIAQDVVVTIDGTNDLPVIGAQTGNNQFISETENALSTAGTIAVSDTDTSDTVIIQSVTLISGGNDSDTATPINSTLLNMFSPQSGDEISNAVNAGSIDWTFNAGTDAFDYLAEGESLELTYTIAVTDGHGGSPATTVEVDVMVTVDGTNDLPVIGAQTGNNQFISETENALSTAGTIAVSDTDTSDTVIIQSVTLVSGGDNSDTATPVNSALLNMFSPQSGDEISNAVNTGSIGWTFNAGTDAFDYLAEGESLELTYTIAVTDGHGGSPATTVEVDVMVTVDGTNDLPVIGAQTGNNQTLFETESTLSTNGTIAVSDVDTTDVVSIQSVTLGTVGNATDPTGPVNLLSMFSPQSGDEVANNTNAGSIGWAFDAGTDAFDYLAAGESLELTYTIAVTDGNGGSPAATVEVDVVVTVDGTNDGPVLSVASGNSAAETLTETNTTLSDSGTLSLADADLTNTVTATIAFIGTTGDTNAITAAVFGNMMSVSGSLDNTEISDQITWNFNSGAEAFDHLGVNDSLDITYRVTVTDGTASTTQDVVITIDGTNDNPVASNAAFTITEDDAAVTGNVLTGAYSAGANTGGATDVDGDTLTVTNVVNNSNVNNAPTVTLGSPTNFAVGNAASYQLNSDGSYTFDPSTGFDNLAAGAQRTFSVTQTVSDGNGGSDTATTTLTVTGINDAPVASAEAGTATSAVQTSGQLDATDVDIGTGSLAFSLATGPASGTATVGSTGAYTYTSNVGFSGTDTFTYSVSDGALSDTETVTVTVAAPIGADANDDTFEIDATSTLNSSGTGVVPNGYGGFVWSANSPSNGTTNPDLYFGSQSGRTYIYAGDHGLQSIISTVGGVPIDLVGLSFHSYGPDPAYIALNSATTVSVTGYNNGVPQYTQTGIPVSSTTNFVTLNFNGIDSIWIMATGLGTAGNGFVEIDDITTGTGVSTIIDEDSIQSIDTAGLLSNDTDASGGTLSITAVSATSTNGAAITLNGNGTISYDPTNAANVQALLSGQTLTDTFTYTVTSTPGGTTDIATVSLVVTGNAANDAPVADEAGITVTEDSSIAGQLAATDPQGTTLNYTVTATAGNGTLVLNSNGSYTYTPNADFSGSDSFSYSVTDGSLSDTGTVAVTVTDVNDAPTLTTGTGSVVSNVGAPHDYAYNMTVQSDGKIILAGTAYIGGEYEFAMARYLPTGELDTSFGGGDGIAIEHLSNGADYIQSVVVQSDGKIIAVGKANNGVDDDFVVTRFLSKGDLDTSFATSGVTPLNGSAGYDSAYSVVIQPDGKLLVGGHSSADKFTVYRYLTDGTIDVSFGTGGKTSYNPGGGSPFGFDIALQSDGKVVQVGRSGASPYDFVVVRYNADGSLDTGFGVGGAVTEGVGPGNDYGETLIIQSDGKIVIVGGVSNGSDNDFGVLRLNSDGSPDLTFGTGGKVLVPIGVELDSAHSVLQQADGKLLIGGEGRFSGVNQFAAVRLNVDGSVDTTFGGGDGIALADLTSGHDSAHGMALLADGSILLSGYGTNGSPGSSNDFEIIKLTSAGDLDTSFGTFGAMASSVNYIEDNSPVILDTGVKITDADLDALNGGAGDYAGASLTVERTGGADAEDVFAIDATGKSFTVSGGNLQSGGQTFATFTSTGGTLSISFTSAAVTATSALADEVLQSVTYENTNNSPPASVETAWTFDDGGAGGAESVVGTVTVDITDVINAAPTFGVGDGIATTVIGTNDDFGQSVTVQADGKILVAGTSNNGTNDDFALVRYNSDGSLDTSFDGDGKLTTAIGSGDDSGESVTLQADGKILVAGISSNGTDNDFALVRYNSDGSLDTSFDVDGKLTTAIGLTHDDGYSVSVQADGKILVAGHRFNGSNYDFALVRYNSDGSPDASFDSDGIQTTAIGSSQDLAYSVTVQADGKILVAGHSSNGPNYDFALVRYNADGSLDSSFDSDGIQTTVIGSHHDYGRSVTVQADGKILVAGHSYNGLNYDFALVRYNADGSPDSSFDSDGIQITDFSSDDDLGYSVTVQADGKILVAGEVQNGANKDFALVRYNSDGSLDASFDGDGKVITAIGSGQDNGRSVTVQADGKILVAGGSHNGSNDEFALVRYNSDGSLDTTFDLDTNLLGGNVAFTEGAAPVFLDTDVNVNDAELDALNGGNGDYAGSSLTIERTGGADAEDVFAIDATGKSFTVSGGNLQSGGQTFATFTVSGGSLIISFTSAAVTATSALADEVLQSVTYENTNNTPPASVETAWTFSDGGPGGAETITDTVTVNLTGVNDAPEVAPDSSTLNYARGDGAVVVDSALTLTDADTATISGATVIISQNFQTGDDVLGFVTQAGISGLYNPVTGELLLSGVATVLQYETALQSITFSNLSNTPSELAREISYVANDGTDDSLVATKTINVSATKTFTGTPSADTLSGDAFDSLILGLGDNDILLGAAGDDTLVGGDGQDNLTGGLGADEFVLGDDSNLPASADAILDYEVGVDTINVEAIVSGTFNAATDLFAETNGSVTSLFVENQLVATMPTSFVGQNLEVIYDSGLAAAQVTVSAGGGLS